MKILLGIIAFTVTFGLSSTVVGLLFGLPQTVNETPKREYSYSAKYKIKRLLKRDIANGANRNLVARKLLASGVNFNSIDFSDEYKNTVIQYYRDSASMNDADLPSDFKYAWRKHMQAWKKQTIYLKNNMNPSSTHSDDDGEINRTWHQLMRIAERYGVEIDESYFQ